MNIISFFILWKYFFYWRPEKGQKVLCANDKKNFQILKELSLIFCVVTFVMGKIPTWLKDCQEELDLFFAILKMQPKWQKGLFLHIFYDRVWPVKCTLKTNLFHILAICQFQNHLKCKIIRNSYQPKIPFFLS